MREMLKLSKSLTGYRGLYASKAEEEAITAVYKKLKQTDRDNTDLIAVLRDLQTAVDEAIGLAPPGKMIGEASDKVYDISGIDFDRLAKEFEKVPKKNTAVQSVKQKVERQLQRMVAQNPTRVDFLERY